MKTKSILNLIQALLFNFVVTVFIAVYFSMDIMLSAVLVMFAAILLGIVKHNYRSLFIGSLFAGLLKEIWISRLMEKFYPPEDFLAKSVDMTEFVEYNTINLADAGVDPNVLINNTIYPVPTSERADTALALPLDQYDTENTVVRNAEEVQLSYNKMDSVLRGHKNALRKKFVQKALYSWAPSSNSTDHPVLITTGAARTGDTGHKRITLEDIALAKKAFDLADYDQEGRVLVLHPTHVEDLILADKDLFKSFVNLPEGKVLRIFGFDVFTNTQTPVFNGAAGTKNAFGAAAASTDSVSSIFWLPSEVMKADGTAKMFSKINDPDDRGDIVGFQRRAVALQIRGKAIGAIVDYHA